MVVSAVLTATAVDSDFCFCVVTEATDVNTDCIVSTAKEVDNNNCIVSATTTRHDDDSLCCGSRYKMTVIFKFVVAVVVLSSDTQVDSSC